MFRLIVLLFASIVSSSLIANNSEASTANVLSLTNDIETKSNVITNDLTNELTKIFSVEDIADYSTQFTNNHLYVKKEMYDGDEYQPEIWKYNYNGNGTKIYAACFSTFYVSPNEQYLALIQKEGEDADGISINKFLILNNTEKIIKKFNHEDFTSYSEDDRWR